MTIDRQSLRFKIVVPCVCIVATVFFIMLAAVGRISSLVQEDYSNFIAAAAGLETQRILSAKASELTSATLMGNPVVAEAMRRSTSEALALMWSRTGHNGIITPQDGSVQFSTLSSRQTSAILAGASPGHFNLKLNGDRFCCYMESFPLWSWNVITVVKPSQSLITRSRINFLAPLVAVGCLMMGAGILWVLRRRLDHPVASLVSSISNGAVVEKTGVTELDFIGSEVNLAFQRLMEESSALGRELEEHAKAEEALRLKEEHISLLLDSTAEGIIGVDLHGNVTFCNPSCLTMLGYTDEKQLIGKHIHPLIHHTRPDGTPYQEDDCRAYSAHREGKMVYEKDEVFWRADGTSFPVEYWSHPVMKDGEINGSVITFIDISERHLLEAQLLHSQKIESLGRLAGGIAHDFNNLLTPIIGYSDLLKYSIPDNQPALAKLDQVLKAAEKAKNLIQQLLSFSRKQILDMQIIDLNKTITAFYEILRCTIRENIELRMHLTEDSYAIRADVHQLEQIIMNLVVNAQDAIHENGVITIETSFVRLDEEYCRQHDGAAPGGYHMLTVADTGSGMDKKTLDKMFEPFFTTKGIGMGTGLGLATVYGLVKQHGGSVRVNSEPGRGTVFKCYFPVVEQATVVDSVQEPARVELRGKDCTILLVEDNQMARELAHELLNEYGFTVLAAESPRKALELAAGCAIDMLITDVVMPEMTGPQLNERLKEQFPALKTLYMSGYTDNIVVNHGVKERGVFFIQKPFTIKDFTAKVDLTLKS